MSPQLLLSSLLWPHLLVAASSGSSKSSSSSSSLFIYILIFAAIGYFLLVRPRARRNRQARQMQQSIEVGDEVILTSGIIGRITWMEGDRARVEVAPETELEVVRAAISRRTAAPTTDAQGSADWPVDVPPATDGVSTNGADAAHGTDASGAEGADDAVSSGSSELQEGDDRDR